MDDEYGVSAPESVDVPASPVETAPVEAEPVPVVEAAPVEAPATVPAAPEGPVCPVCGNPLDVADAGDNPRLQGVAFCHTCTITYHLPLEVSGS